MRYTNNIKHLQNARGLTIDQAANAMGMSRGGYLKIQRGENRLTSTTISQAARVFGVSAGEIVSDAGTVVASARGAAPTPQTPEGETVGPEPTIVAEYFGTVGEDGTTTLPAELRAEWNLRPGDKVEFFEDHAGGWQLRPRNSGPLAFLDFLPPRPKRPDALTDDEALTRAMAERNLSSSPKAET